MHARSTTIMARPDSIDAGIGYVRDEVMPMLLALNGCIGLSLLVDRSSGRCIATSAWQDEESMRASDEQLRSVRSRAAEMMGGAEPSVEEWAIAVLHRDHTSQQGACARVTWVRTQPNRVDDTVEFWKATVLPWLESYDGFCSASLMVNRQSGLTAAAASFDSREAMDRSSERAREMRDRAVQEAGIEIVETGEFELALAHLRVPELV